jgi:hypothetical protein
MAVHPIDGAEQYFTRAYEFGYSFSVEETLRSGGRKRTWAISFASFEPPAGRRRLASSRRRRGGQHHQTSAILTKEAFRAARIPRASRADRGGPPALAASSSSTRESSRSGPRREREGKDQEKEDPGSVVRIDTGQYDPILGRTYHQMGSEARANHKCQGMGQLQALAGPHESVFRLEDTVLPRSAAESDLFDGVAVGLERLKDFTDQPFVAEGLDALRAEVEAANAAFDAGPVEDASAAPRARPCASSGRTRRGLPPTRSSARASSPSPGGGFEKAIALPTESIFSRPRIG